MSEVYKIFGLGAAFPFGDGISSLDMLVTFIDFDRLLVEPIYKDESLKKDTRIKGFVPFSPENENQILQDAFLLFAPSVFKKIKNYAKLVEITDKREFYEINERNQVWQEIRKESKPIFRQLNIFELAVKKK